MGKSYIGGIATPHYYKLNVAAPIDNRDVVDTINDLYDAETWRGTDAGDENLYIYEGLTVYVKEAKTSYTLVDIEKYNTPDGWKEAGSEVVDMYKYISDNNGSTEGIDEMAALSVGSGLQLLKDKVGLVDGKIPFDVLPDSVTSGLVYGGTATVQASSNITIATLSVAFINLSDGTVEIGDVLEASLARSYPNVFFIINRIAGEDFGYAVGDWVISSGNTWEHIKQANTISSIAGLTGVITVEDLVNKLTTNELTDTIELATIADVKSLAQGAAENALRWNDVSLPTA